MTSNRIALTRGQADYLAKLKAEADRASDTFAACMNAVALAAGDNGDVTYDLGPEPWVEVTPKGAQD